MTVRCFSLSVFAVLFALGVQAQKKKERLPDVSSTIKGSLILPVPLGNPLFEAVTESVGQVDGLIQFPIAKGLSLGAGGKMTWFQINERALAPFVTTGEIRRLSFYGKVAYEQYTGERTFYELNARVGNSTYWFDCPTCGNTQRSGLHWGIGTGYYIHASDNLAFGLTLGYETDGITFGAPDLGLQGFPGRPQLYEARQAQYLIIGMGFSTRLRKTPDSGPGW
jgi:hypothetical protein